MSRRFQLILALAGLCLQSLAAGAFSTDANTLALQALHFHNPSMSPGPDPINADAEEPVWRTDSTPAISDIEKAGETDRPKSLADPIVAGWPVYSLPEGVAQRSGDRSRIEGLGLGGHRRLGQWVQLTGEVSVGDGSVGALVGGSCNINDRIQLYTSSGVDTIPIESAAPGLNGTLTSGARWRVSEKAGVFGEERLKIGDGQRGGTHAFGLDLRPASHWTWGTTLEMGELSDPSAGTRHRQAGSLSVGYSRKDIRYGGRLELDMEGGEGLIRSKAWNARNDVEIQTAKDWRLLSSLNASLCSAHEDSSFEGAHFEGLIELVHTRFNQDSLTVLVKYTFSPDSARDWQTDLQVGVFSPVNEVMRVGIGYNFADFSNAGTEPSSDDQGWFLEIAGKF